MKELYPWFVARLLFERVMTDLKSPAPDALFEDRLVVLYSEEGEAAAMKKTKKVGKSEAHAYKNIDGETVSWVFREASI